MCVSPFLIAFFDSRLQGVACVHDIILKLLLAILKKLKTAGSVLAARLTENPNVSVLVLEAGAARINDPLIGEL